MINSIKKLKVGLAHSTERGITCTRGAQIPDNWFPRQVIIFVVMPNIFSIVIVIFVLSYNCSYHLTCTKQEGSGNCNIHSALQNCGSAVWKLLHITILVSRIWRSLLSFGNFCAFYIHVHLFGDHVHVLMETQM
jgi:hypothetical protein